MITNTEKHYQSDGYLEAVDAILSLGPAVAVVWDLSERWPVKFVSPNIVRFGYEPDDLLSGRIAWIDLVAEEDLERISAQVAEAIKSGATHSEQRYRIRTADGQLRWIADYTTLLRDKTGIAHTAQGVLVDVTTEHEFAEFRAAQVRFLEGNPHPYFQLLPGRELAFANEAASSLFESLKSAPDDARRHFEALCDEWLSATSVSTSYHKISDRIFWVLVDPGDSGPQVNVYSVDVTADRQRAIFVDQMVENLPDLMVHYRRHCDGSDSVELLNPHRLSAFGLSYAKTGSADTLDFWRVILPECLPSFQDSLNRSEASLEEWHHEFRIVDEGGGIRWVSGFGSPFRHTDGSTSWTSLFREITNERQTRDALAEAMGQTIQVLADAVEMRDAYTAGHQNAVSDIAVAIAAELGLDAYQIDGLRLAAAVHDVGKIRIPIEILSKPDRLNKNEYELIKGHSTFGADLLAKVNAPWPIADMVRQHHERMDGSGYPDGLRGEEILLEARIIAVSDVLEAISSDRPYRAARGMSVARQELVRGRGSIYDPDVVDAALALIDRGDVTARSLSQNT
ncbi:MAG: HD domain-containing phosphohydrolase, partial [Halieaceae bacterium]|nr:HD domain-containing phosphohydrolase [Halieaceae bacterium]